MHLYVHVDETIKTECFTSKLRSIIGQLKYSYEICRWDGELGVPFRTHFYVPEKHLFTQMDYHEREDEGHVFKVSLHILHKGIKMKCIPLIAYWKSHQTGRT